ncbi:carboxylic acid transporter [Moniliophthora roreri MCA 2997]|uniref:Carboxylic acid transporter n=1 Tax=Moniliophthora roreri (strain MCA 2997) TaxID=1381753 RepID=V2WVH9_MONRO|nr:carboxylic acid transporter [Moniliophthora roreri MCA 2997]
MQGVRAVKRHLGSDLDNGARQYTAVDRQKVVGVGQIRAEGLAGTVGVREILISWRLERTLFLTFPLSQIVVYRSFLRPVRCFTVFLLEISPPAFRASFAGLSYPLSSAFQSRGSNRSSLSSPSTGFALGTETMNVNGDAIPKYAAVQDILVGAAALCSLIFAPFGPENHGQSIDTESDGENNLQGCPRRIHVRCRSKVIAEHPRYFVHASKFLSELNIRSQRQTYDI